MYCLYVVFFAVLFSFFPFCVFCHVDVVCVYLLGALLVVLCVSYVDDWWF